MVLPRIINSPVPPAPRKMTFGCSATINKKEARKLHLLVHPLTRPAHISPNKKVSWRLVKKWFNRYEKPIWLKRTVMVVANAGKDPIQARITDAHITKVGGHIQNLSISCKPLYS